MLHVLHLGLLPESFSSAVKAECMPFLLSHIATNSSSLSLCFETRSQSFSMHESSSFFEHSSLIIPHALQSSWLSLDAASAQMLSFKDDIFFVGGFLAIQHKKNGP
tara:strand:+ start:300 stop:617 length:318 start_codon:yes stop_codon:yes gene_type:complete